LLAPHAISLNISTANLQDIVLALCFSAVCEFKKNRTYMSFAFHQVAAVANCNNHQLCTLSRFHTFPEAKPNDPGRKISAVRDDPA